MKTDVFSKSVYEKLRNVWHAQGRTPFGKDLPTHIFCNEDGSTCRRVSESMRRGSIIVVVRTKSVLIEGNFELTL